MASLYVAPSFGDGVLASSEAISLLNIMSLFLILDSSLFDSSLTLNAVSKALIDDAATTAVVMMVGIISWFVQRVIVQPITGVLEKMNNADLNTIVHDGRTDEIGELTLAL